MRRKYMDVYGWLDSEEKPNISITRHVNLSGGKVSSVKHSGVVVNDQINIHMEIY